jgi:hypothetical protein
LNVEAYVRGWWFCFLVACGGAVVSQTPMPAPLPEAPMPPSTTATHAVMRTDVCLEDANVTMERSFEPKPLEEADLAKAEATATTADKPFARGRTYFQARHWVESARAFRTVAFAHPDTDVGIYAVTLYLESLNILGAHGNRPGCYEDMARDVPPLAALYCGTRRSAHEEQCVVLEKVEADIERLAAQRLIERADRDPNDPADYRAGAQKYMSVLSTYCLLAKVIDHCDEIAFNAASAFIAAHDMSSAVNVQSLMLNPNNRMDRSPLTKRLTCKLDPSNIACH